MTPAIDIPLHIFLKNIFSKAVTHSNMVSSQLQMTSSTNDQDLIAGILRQDDDYVLRFVRLYENRVYAQSLRLLQNGQDAEEVSQDVFMKALRKMPEFKGKSKLSTWLYSITYTTCLDVLKKRRRRGYEEDIDDHRTADWSNLENGLTKLEDQEQRNLIDNSMATLDETDAMLIDMYYLQGSTTAELAEITGLKEGNIRIRMMRARKKLGTQLERTLPTETLEQYRHGGK